MPFLVSGPDSQSVLLFCQADLARVWKAHVRLPDGTIWRLPTCLPADICECSPTAWCDAAGWHLTLIAGGQQDNPRFHLYRFDGPALDRLSPPVAMQATRTGFIYKDRLVYGDVENLVHVRQPLGDKVIELPGAFIYRVAYRADAPDKLLISGQWQQEKEVFTLEYDLATNEQRTITCDGKPAYKCTILGETVLYADRIPGGGEQFEDRRIVQAKITRTTKTQIAVARLPDQITPASTVAVKTCNCKGKAEISDVLITRPSCLECVEKHLGAAYVLLTETQNGYAHRLRAVGHLHEAEDESQQWPALHETVRAARKAYQTQGTMPDWQKLQDHIEETRTSGGGHAQ